MAVRDIVSFNENEAALREKNEPVRVVNRRIKKLIKDLKDTLAVYPEGIGLAAPQINVHQQVILVRLGSKREDGGEADPPLVLINPEIIKAKNEEKDFDGCLSFPGLFAETVRPHYLRVKGLDEWGKAFDRVFKGFDAVLVRHEIDHLN
ncbi:MAG: peptide deformylase, partial [Desulfobacterales bacterium]|nr:peptide deformylase [Desulfobacterales bacterium]